ncbi:MAG: YdeI/OmpD-associated family protein [Rhodobacter sp.]|nr:YdeI/OmpD-associated family protein [Rhodobacter sp.]
MITDVEDFFIKGCGRCDRFDTPDCSARRWDAGLARLRGICQGAGLVETVKWAHPCYMHAGRNIALVGAFRADFRLSFFNAALLKDPEAVLERQGPNSRTPGMMRFTANDQVEEREPLIRSYLAEAMVCAEQGLKPPRDNSEPDLPEELTEALESDPDLAEAFAALTPGRRRSYVINLRSAKQAETRMRRIDRFRDRIIAGKGAMER